MSNFVCQQGEYAIISPSCRGGGTEIDKEI